MEAKHAGQSMSPSTGRYGEVHFSTEQHHEQLKIIQGSRTDRTDTGRKPALYCGLHIVTQPTRKKSKQLRPLEVVVIHQLELILTLLTDKDGQH